MKKAFIVDLRGADITDVTIKLVDEKTWNWIFQDNIDTPEELFSRIRKNQGEDFDEDDLPNEESGTPENDRAILAPTLEDNNELYSAYDFRDVFKMVNLARENGYEVELKEYKGGMY